MEKKLCNATAIWCLNFVHILECLMCFSQSAVDHDTFMYTGICLNMLEHCTSKACAVYVKHYILFKQTGYLRHYCLLRQVLSSDSLTSWRLRRVGAFDLGIILCFNFLSPLPFSSFSWEAFKLEWTFYNVPFWKMCLIFAFWNLLRFEMKLPHCRETSIKPRAVSRDRNLAFMALAAELPERPTEV